MAKKIIYGVGQAVLRKFADKSKIIGYTDLQDLSFESSFSKEDITGGNKLFPIASFKKDSSVKVSATNATFNSEMVSWMDGATESVAGATTFPKLKEAVIVAGEGIVLDETPIEGSVVINGFTAATAAPTTAGQFKVDAVTKTITFADADAGKSIVIFYEYKSSAKTVGYTVTNGSLSTPFEFDYMFPVYDENTSVTHQCVIKVYKMTTTSGFSIDPKHQSPVAPKFEAEAKDPQRSDGHFWDFYIDEILQA